MESMKVLQLREKMRALRCNHGPYNTCENCRIIKLMIDKQIEDDAKSAKLGDAINNANASANAKIKANKDKQNKLNRISVNIFSDFECETNADLERTLRLIATRIIALRNCPTSLDP